MSLRFTALILLIFIVSCKTDSVVHNVNTELGILGEDHFTWDNATVYFLLTDRFNNGNTANDGQDNPGAVSAPYRGFMGGDIKGVTEKIKEGYFDKLGVNAIWTTPVLEQISGSVDEGTGISYPFHGYWTKDWTSFDERFTTEAEFKEFVETAHAHGIRVIMDVIVNHTGPVTPEDTVWPDSWVRTGPRCKYKDAKSTITCTLVDNLPDIKTESQTEVDLPPMLVAKWKKEGRYQDEVRELNDFFVRTKYPRRPYFYIIKWLVDYIKKYGIDGFRADTVKHTEDQVWRDLFKEAEIAFAEYKKKNAEAVLDESPFFMVGEVYNYYISGGRYYNLGDKKVDYFTNAFQSMINFDFKGDANQDYETIFSKYNNALQGEMSGKSVLNYISSHDDGNPFDLKRTRSIESATKLLLSPGGVQIYYGDETARSLTVEAKGDATLRSFMNWDELKSDPDKQAILLHWQKLGKFRSKHPAIGAGRHNMISESPYTFSRVYQDGDNADKVVVALDAGRGPKSLSVGGIFEDGTMLKDGYSGVEVKVEAGKIQIDTEFDLVLLAAVK